MTKHYSQLKCPICHGWVPRTSGNQVTCGNPECVSARTIQIMEERFEERRRMIYPIVKGGCYFDYTHKCNGLLNVHMNETTYREFSANDKKHSLFHLNDKEFNEFLLKPKVVLCTKHLLMVSIMERDGDDWDDIVCSMIDEMTVHS